jgi:hypothetical protein
VFTFTLLAAFTPGKHFRFPFNARCRLQTWSCRSVEARDRQCTYEQNAGVPSRNYCCRWKAILHSVCVCVCKVRAAYCHMLSVYHIFSHCLIHCSISGKQFIKHKMSFDFLHNFSLKYSIRRRMQRDIAINANTSWCKVPVSLVRF